MKANSNPSESISIYKPGYTYSGYTLYAPVSGKEALLIDMLGNVLNRWELPTTPASHALLLPSGNLLYAGNIPNARFDNFDGAGGVLVELNWQGKEVWRFEDEYMHHDFCRMDNGNTLILRWVRVPDKIKAKVVGGIPGTADNIMWTDSFREITPQGKTAWEWNAFEHLDTALDTICQLCYRTEWTHANACQVMPDGNILTSFSRLHTLAIIDKSSGNIKWRWGRGEIAHQNAPVALNNGNILFFDNGVHSHGYPMGFSRVVEVNPLNNEMVWAYEDTPRSNFDNSVMGSCQRLLNGNTLICESTTGRLFEVTQWNERVWEFTNPTYYQSSFYGRNNYIGRAYRYDCEYEGLQGNRKAKNIVRTAVSGEKRPQTTKQESKVKSRLEALGY